MCCNRDLNGGERLLAFFAGAVAEAQSGQATPARQASMGQNGQARPSPRHKTPQPQCPPHKDAKGFTMGRGRALPPHAPAAPGSSSFLGQLLPTAQSAQVDASNNAVSGDLHSPASSQTVTEQQQQQQQQQPSSVPSNSAPVSSSSGQAHLGQQFLHQLQQPQARAEPSAPAHIGQAFLQQLQAGPSRAEPVSDLGKGFLQQLQQGSASSSTTASNPLSHFQSASAGKHAPAGSATADSNTAGRALLSQLQRPAAQPSMASAAAPHSGMRPSLADEQISSAAAQQQHSRLLHNQQVVYPAQAVKYPQGARPGQPIQAAQATQPNPGTVLLEQLLGSSAAATPQPARPSQSAGQGPPAVPPPRQVAPAVPPPGQAASAILPPGVDMAAASATSFQQMLRAALNKQDHSQNQTMPPTQVPGLLQSQTGLDVPDAAPPGFAPTPAAAPPGFAATPAAGPPGFAPVHMSPAQQQATFAALHAGSIQQQQQPNAGWQLLQQLQQAAPQNSAAALLQSAAAPQQPTAGQQQQTLFQNPAGPQQPVLAYQLPQALGQQHAAGHVPVRHAPAGQSVLEQQVAGQMLLQQLQRGLNSAAPASPTASGSASEAQAGNLTALQGGSVGSVPGALQPMPSAPPAPAAVLLQDAARQNGTALPQGRGQGRHAGRGGRGRTGEA